MRELIRSVVTFFFVSIHHLFYFTNPLLSSNRNLQAALVKNLTNWTLVAVGYLGAVLRSVITFFLSIFHIFYFTNPLLSPNRNPQAALV